MRGLAILTHRAQKAANPDRYVDRRTLPKCMHFGCRRKVLALPNGHSEHCYDHASAEERAAYVSAWSKAS